MKLYKTDLIEDIQKRFNRFFPLLSLQFYKEAHLDERPSPNRDQFPVNTPLASISNYWEDGSIILTGDTTVYEIESLFEEVFELHVQVFRKSGMVWLQTSATDHWTLFKHQEKAKEMELKSI